MKVVYFKIKGQRFVRHGPVFDTDTEEKIIKRLSRVFKVVESDITILELK